jgi:hypothetical protein
LESDIKMKDAIISEMSALHHVQCTQYQERLQELEQLLCTYMEKDKTHALTLSKLLDEDAKAKAEKEER